MASPMGRRSPSPSRAVPPSHRSSSRSRRHGGPLPPSPSSSTTGGSGSPPPASARSADNSGSRSPSPEARHGGRSPPTPSPTTRRRSASPRPATPGTSPRLQPGVSTALVVCCAAPRGPSPPSASPSPAGQRSSPSPAPGPPESILRTMWGRLSGSKRRRSDWEEPSPSPSTLPTARRSASSTLPTPPGSLVRSIWGWVTGAKRRLPDDGFASPPPAPKRRQISRSMLWGSLSSDGLVDTLLRGVRGASSFLRRSPPPLPYLPSTVMCLVLRFLPIRQIIRCSTVCKGYISVLCSDEFRWMCRSSSNCRGPLLAAFAHPHVSKSPVAIPHGPFSELQLSLDFGGRDFSFVADSRDGYLLMFTHLTPMHQRFSLCNPLTQMVMDLPMLTQRNEYLVYIAASFIPDEKNHDFEVIVLYATGHASRMTTALYSSKQVLWFFDDHEVAFTVPNCFLRIRQPSILVERQLNFLFKGNHTVSVNMELSREVCTMKKMQPNLRAVDLSHVPLPIEFQWTGILLDINNLLGKIGGKLCFIGTSKAGGITVWLLNRNAEGDQIFDEPRELTIAGQTTPTMMLLGFAESNEVLMAQRSVASDVILLIDMGTSTLTYLARKNQELRVFAYEMEFPPTSMLHRHLPLPDTDNDDHSSD